MRVLQPGAQYSFCVIILLSYFFTIYSLNKICEHNKHIVHPRRRRRRGYTPFY